MWVQTNAVTASPIRNHIWPWLVSSLKPLVLFFILHISVVTIGQTNQVFSGRIIDQSTKESLVGANIYLKKDMSIGTVSDFNGYFALSVEPGNHQFVVSFTGMKTQTILVNINNEALPFRIIEMEPFSTQFDEVVVRAGRFDKRLEDQTVSIEVIKPRLIDARNTTSVETILDMVPGLTILDEEPQIRGGSGFTFGVGSKVAVFVDNLPVVAGDAGKPDWSLIPVENIKQIEVVKGASSVLSGSSALSGAIYIRTNYPDIQPKTKIKLYSGWMSKPSAPAEQWWSGINYASGASFLHSQQLGNGHTDLVVGGMFSADKSYLGAPHPGPLVIDTVPISDQQMENRKARINFNFRRRSEKIKGLNFGLNGNLMAKKASTVFAWLDDTTNFYRAYPGAVLLSDNVTFYLDPYLNFYSSLGLKHEFNNRIMHSDNQANNDQSTNTWFIYNAYQFSKSFSNLGNLDFIGGVTSQYTRSYAHLYEASGSPLNQLWNLSLFMEIEKKFGDAINISAGVRVENYQLNDSISDTKPIFRVGASIKLGQETYLRASLGQGYRFPTITERYIRTSVGSFGVFDNPDLEPETSWNSELGIKQGFKFKNYYGYLDVAFFYQEYNNTIEYLFGFWDPTYTFALAGFKFVNTGKSKITGIDISQTGQLKAGKHLEINTMVGYTYVMPVTLQPDYIFTHDYNPGGQTDFSYESTSVDPSKRILKYRYLHTLKADIEVVYKNISLGGSVRYFSKIENLDQAIFDFEDATISTGGTLQPILYRSYYEHHNNGNMIIDARISYKLQLRHEFALISSNLLNRMYSLRPLKAEPMRNITVQYILTL
jgi:iron complex outermembrane receptor protein